MNRITKLLIILMAPVYGLAQSYSGEISAVDSSQTYKIALGPEIQSAMRGNTAYVRILDSNKQEVPYLPWKDELAIFGYRLLDVSKHKTDTSSTYIFEKKTGESWRSIFLNIAGNDLRKTFTISAGNDLKEWFGIADKGVLTDMRGVEATVRKEIQLPPNNFRYFKIDFDDKRSLPLYIESIEVSDYHEKKHETYLLENVTRKTAEEKEKKRTRIDLAFAAPQVIDRLVVEVGSPALYRRQTRVFIPERNTSARNKSPEQREVGHFTLSSDTPGIIEIPGLLTDRLILEITNDDNPPLRFESISLLQNKRYIAANLKERESYTLVIDTLFKTPRYDLSYFETTFQGSMPELEIKETHHETTRSEKTAKQEWLDHKAFLWSCILIGILIIGYFSRSLIKDLNKQKEEEN